MENMIPGATLDALCVQFTSQVERKRKLSAAQLVSALVFHQLQPAGTLGTHARQLHGPAMSEPAHAERRQGMPLGLFEAVMSAALQPLAEATRHPQSFYAGRRLVGVDGTQFSVSNTPAIAGRLSKALTRRLRAAFAKVRLVTLVELGLHNPLAAAVGLGSTGEQTLAAGVWAHVPENALVLMDRLFGLPLTLWQAQQAWAGRDIAVLARVKANVKVQVLTQLADGSAIVEVPVVNARRPRVDTLRVREIHASGVTTAGRPFHLRLWTTLLDAQAHPAETLARLYRQRWEHETYYHLLKLDIRGSDILASHTVETALQEMAALVLATAVIARVRVAAGLVLDAPPTRVSFLKVLLPTLQLWRMFAWSVGILTPEQQRQLVAVYLEEIRATALLPARRARSCPRAVRQVMSSWPRKIHQPCFQGRATVFVTRFP